MTNKPELKIEAGRFYRDGLQRKWEAVKVVFGSSGRFLAVQDDNGSYFTRWFYLDGKTIDPLNPSCDIISEWIDAPEVDWSKMAAWHNWASRDKNGDCHGFGLEPYIEDNEWICSRNSDFYGQIPPQYFKFTGDWKDSLVCRPGVEE